MPAEFLTEAQARRYGRFQADPSPEQLERYFALGPDDLASIGRRREDWTRLGFAIQLGTVRFLGTFVTRLEETPPSVIQHMAATLGVSPGEWTTYVSSRARLVHTAEISRLHGYVSFGDAPLSGRFLRWLYERAWTGDDRPTVLLDLSTAWLVDHKVLLPCVTRLTKLVARVRERANRRAWRQISRSVKVDQRRVLDGLLEIDPATSTSGLDRLRRPPSSPTVDGLVAALDRLEEVQALGAQGINLEGAPAGRIRALAREAFSVKAQRVARRTPDRRLATLAAFACRLHQDAHDDVIDVFLSVAATMSARAERAGRTQRLASLADLDAAALVLRQAAMVVLDGQVPDPTVRSSVFEIVSPEQLQAAVDLIGRTSGAGDVSLVGLLSRYPTVQRFLPRLLELVHFDATHVNDVVLAALRHLRLVNRGEAAIAAAPTGIVSDAWRQLAMPDDAIDKRGYTLCLVDKLRAALRRRDVFVPAGDRWGDPRRLLLEPAAWKRAEPGVLANLALPTSPGGYLAGLARELDTGYRHAASALAADPALWVDTSDPKRDRVRLARLEASPEPASTALLRGDIHALLHTVDLPEILLEVNRWCRFTDAFTNASGGGGRIPDLDLSVCAVLLAQACNVGYRPVTRGDVPALTQARLAWVAANYIRPETIVAANTCLVDLQAQLGIARIWGGGEVASADGIRFAVPVRSIHSGPNPRYFGSGRGVTLYNFVADTYTGFAHLVVPGTLRDSQFILDGLLNNPTSLDPHHVVADTGGVSELIFGCFRLLGYLFTPRMADLPDRRYWRMDANADYGALNRVARQRINSRLITEHWADILRVAGTLHTRTVTASELIRALQRAGHPTALARAIAEIGRIDKTIAQLRWISDEHHRRAVGVQANRHEARHSLARSVFHGRRGDLYQAYRRGQEEQLGALGLVVNAVTLWNSRYMDRAVDHLRNLGQVVDDGDLERISPLIHGHIELHGRYSFNPPEHIHGGELRPLPHLDG